MLKRMSIRKIMVASLSLVALFLIYLMPSNKSYDYPIKTESVEYIYTNTLNTLYLMDSNGYIARTSIKGNEGEIIDIARDVLNALIIGGNRSDIIPNGFRAIIPSGTEILDIKLDKDILIVDLSKEILSINTIYEEKMIESIIYSLTSIKDINKIKLKVEGIVLDKLPNSGKSLPEILDRSYGINKNYNLVNTSDIDSYTIYYVSKIEDNSYYVPITKYVNNKGKDKIKIIIEELSTSPIYEDNLMSFLNSDVSLIDYELESDILNLNFSDSIFIDKGSSDILEEVIYTIGLSFQDSLNVKDVSLLVENKEIYENLLKMLE